MALGVLPCIVLSSQWMSVLWRTGIEADLQASFPAAVRPWIKGCPWILTVGGKGRTRLEHPAQTLYPPMQHLEKAAGAIVHIRC